MRELSIDHAEHRIANPDNLLSSEKLDDARIATFHDQSGKMQKTNYDRNGQQVDGQAADALPVVTFYDASGHVIPAPEKGKSVLN